MANLSQVKVGNTTLDVPAGVNYSTSEFDTGNTWIDGKKIYGRVYTGLNTNTSGSNKDMVDISGYNINTLIGIYGIVDVGGYYVNFPTYADASSYIAPYTTPNFATIRMNIGSSYRNKPVPYLAIFYTKTS